MSHAARLMMIVMLSPRTEKVSLLDDHLQRVPAIQSNIVTNDIHIHPVHLMATTSSPGGAPYSRIEEHKDRDARATAVLLPT